MHIQVTDVLACPRCGGGFGLVLLADRVVERRVLVGELGCPNCRERYPIRNGFADLRTVRRGSRARNPYAGGGPPTEPAPEPPAHGPEAGERSTRLAALLGLSEPRRLVALLGPLAREAPGVAALVEGVEIVAADAALEAWPESAGVSRIAIDPGLPILDRTLGAVALSGAADADRLELAARAVAPLGRVVIEDAPADAATRLVEEGMEVLAADAGTIVAVSKGLA